jgi:hypothetical protein
MFCFTLVAHSDNNFSDDEHQYLFNQINCFKDINDMARQRLNAHLKWLSKSGPDTTGLKKKLVLLLPGQKTDLAYYLIGTAGADGYIDPAEIKMLNKKYSMPGFDSQELYAHLHQVSLETVKDEGLVTVKKGEESDTGYRIPQFAPPTKNVILDHKKIELKLNETRDSQAILEEIFAEDEDMQSHISENSLVFTNGLDQQHILLQKDLSEKEQWDRLEYE